MLYVLWLDEENGWEYKPVGSLEQFLSLHQLSGHPVTVVYTQDEFDETLNEITQGPS
jgi:hypothetical protein